MSLQKGKIIIYMIRNLISLLASPGLGVLAKNVLIISKFWLTVLAYDISAWYFNVLHTIPKKNQTKVFLLQCSIAAYFLHHSVWDQRNNTELLTLEGGEREKWKRKFAS